jgi:uncharacterized protein (DUF1330 family)
MRPSRRTLDNRGRIRFNARRAPHPSLAMPKAYWIACYHSIDDPQKLAAYAALAGPALQAAGARFLARGMPAQVYEGGMQQRTVLIEFDSVQAARAAHDSPAYREALEALGDGAVRDLRIVEGLA